MFWFLSLLVAQEEKEFLLAFLGTLCSRFGEFDPGDSLPEVANREVGKLLLECDTLRER